jgi:hypothetical protein
MSGTMAFRADDTAMHSQFDLSSAEDGPVLSYNGVQIAQDTARKEAGITQMPYIHKLLSDPLAIKNVADIQSVRGKLAWLANVSRPDIAIHVAALSQITATDTEENIDESKRIVSIIRGILGKSTEIGPRYLPLAYGPKRVVAFADASSAWNCDGSSQIAGIIFLLGGTADAAGTTEPAHMLTYFSRSRYASAIPYLPSKHSPSSPRSTSRTQS